MARDESMWRRVCLVHGFGDGDKEGREREWNKQHQHCLANLKDASRGEQAYSAILREDAGLSSPPTDSSSSRPRDVSKIFLYRRHFKISYISFVRALLFVINILIYLFTQVSTGGTAENSSILKSSAPPKPTRTTPSHQQ